MNNNQLQLLNQKLNQLIGNKITVTGSNQINVNGKVVTFNNTEPKVELSKRTTTSR